MTPEPDHDPLAHEPFGVTADIVVFTIRDGRFQVLLVERGQATDTFRGWDALPGGFLHPDESAETAARRELREETGVDADTGHLEQLRTYSTPDRDPRQRVVSVAFLALIPGVGPVRGGTDTSDAYWVPVEELESDMAERPDGQRRLAFDHDAIFLDAVERARAKFEYTTVATRFCPPEFTMTDLRLVYEAVWGEKLDAANFRRKVMKGIDVFFEPTGRTTHDPPPPDPGPGDTSGAPAAWSAPEARESWSLLLLENRRFAPSRSPDLDAMAPLPLAAPPEGPRQRKGRPADLYRRRREHGGDLYPPIRRPGRGG